MTTVEHFAASARATYDRIAHQYDDLWTRHVVGQHARLTKDLRIQRGERLVDIACGRGTTLEMMHLNTPGETVAVDNSPAMLEGAKAAAAAENLALTGICCTAQEFIDTCEPETFDVVSMRFGLAYVDWQHELGRLGRLVRKGRGRVGLLTSLASSAPQALTTYHEFMEELGMEKAWPPVPKDTAQISELLAAGGLETEIAWTERVRLYFDTGLSASNWFLDSGYITSRTISSFPEEVLEAFKPIYAARLEQKYREEQGVPIDFDIGGVVAVKR